MKPSNKALATEDKLSRTVNHHPRIIQVRTWTPILHRLQQARERALGRFDQRITQPPSLANDWRCGCCVTPRHCAAAHWRSVLPWWPGTGVWLAEGLLMEEEAVDAAILSHELPLEVLMDPHFSGSMHD
jgi:hypothetical protein